MSARFIFIAGPCVIESEALLDEVASALAETVSRRKGWDFYFKASFDKANRSAHDSFRGPGLDRGLEMLAKVRKKFGVKVLTDVHAVEHCAAAAQAVDALQIPAFLCRQTDLIQAAATAAKKHGRSLNVKKGQFLAPWDMLNVVEKVEATTGDKKPQWLWLTERGSSFGYNNLVVDMTSFPIMRGHGVPVVFDATHSVQLPGGAAGGKTTGGRREFIAPLSRAAVAVGIDGLFMETHPRPAEAKSDAANAFPLSDVPAFLDRLERVREAAVG
ncbi:MAG: 3-deoxy-8-phosphooctulonate synthase [Deltaproteobacteria bacterium]|nr:3-deoxy-8-phosphooctulonate synthase [Deltaproteobacteria bacterium]